MKKSILKITVFSFLQIFFISTITSQHCDLPKQIEYLNANNIRAGILNRGDNFWDLDQAQFQVPYGQPNKVSSIFATSMWLSGKDDDDEIRGSFFDYRQSSKCSYNPGPVFKDSNRPSSDDLNNWNKLFSVTQNDILLHIEDAKDGKVDNPIASIFGWPSSGNKFFETIHGFPMEFGTTGGAFFHEVQGSVNGTYEPHLGEYPHVEGMNPSSLPGQIIWCVYNNSNFTTRLGSKPMGFEIQQTAYAMSCDNLLLSNSVFISYKIINKSGIDYTDVKMAQWMDTDLGCPFDDFMGCMPDLNTFYGYNSDSIDGIFGNTGNGCRSGIETYLGAAPVQTVTFLNSKMDAFMTYINGAVGNPNPNSTDPETVSDFVNYMNARWRDGSPLNYGGDGYDPNGSNPTKFMFPSSPTDKSGWSLFQEKAIDNDRRTIASTSKGDLKNNDFWTIDLAFTYHQDEQYNHIEIVDHATTQIPLLQKLYDDGFADCQRGEINTCDCTCVWPGDTDNNGEVNYLDYINVVKGLSESGDTRVGPLYWKGESVNDWNSTAIDNTNNKHADVNGDGIIDLNDLELIEDFIDQSNDCLIKMPTSCPEGTSLTWRTKRTDSLFNTKSRIRNTKGIVLNLKKDFQGLSYEIKFDENLFKLKSRNTHPLDVWSRSISSVIKSIYTTDINNITTIGVIQFNTIGQDKELDDDLIFRTEIITKQQPSTYKAPYAEVRICNAKMYFADGSTELLPAKSIKYYFDDTVKVTSTSPGIAQDHFIKVFPNPAFDNIVITTDLQNATAQLLNINGKLIMKKKLAASKTTLDVSSIPRGLYILTLASKDGILSKKIMVQ